MKLSKLNKHHIKALKAMLSIDFYEDINYQKMGLRQMENLKDSGVVKILKSGENRGEYRITSLGKYMINNNLSSFKN